MRLVWHTVALPQAGCLRHTLDWIPSFAVVIRTDAPIRKFTKKTVSTVCHVRSKPFLHQDLGNRRKGLSIQRFSSHDCRRDGRHHRRSNARPTCGARPGLWPGLALEHAWAWQEGDAKSEMRGFGAFSQAAFLRDLDRHLSPAALEATQLRALGAAK